MVSVMGRAQLRRYQTQDGADREDLELVADSLVSARTSRPSGKRTASSPPSSGSIPGPRSLSSTTIFRFRRELPCLGAPLTRNLSSSARGLSVSVA